MIGKIVEKVDKIYNFLMLKKYKIVKGENLTIHGRIIFSGSNVEFGNNVTINSKNKANPIGGAVYSSFCTWNKGKIKIGNNVGISNSSICSYDSVTIEDDVLLGGGVKIYDTDFHSIDYDNRMLMENDKGMQSAPIIIKKGAFIGAHSIILKGVTIGERAVVGAGSIVTKDIPADEIWGGNPAKKIKSISKKGE